MPTFELGAAAKIWQPLHWLEARGFERLVDQD